MPPVSFLNPAGLWLLLGIPAVLALWVLRPRRRRVRVPSLLLWPGSPAQREAVHPWQRLRAHPLLWLQLAAVVLLAGAAAQPYSPASATARHIVVLLDASGSMRGRDVAAPATDRFGAAKAALLDLARGLGPGQDVTVIRVDEQPRTLVSAAQSAADVERALAGQAASFAAPDLNTALALAAGAVPGPAEWVLIGDGALAIPPEARRPAGTAFRTIAVGSSGANVALTGLSGRADGGSLTLQAGLRNTGTSPISGRAQLLAEGQLLAVREWHLEAGTEMPITWSGLPLTTPSTPPSTGASATGPGPTASTTPAALTARWYEVRLSGVDPASNVLPQDDLAWAALGGSEQVSLLLVTAGAPFLERALLAQDQVRAFKAAPADWPALAQAAPYPLTVLDRLATAPLPKGSALLLGPPEGDEFVPSGVWVNDAHPLLRHVDWSDVLVTRARRVPLVGSDTTGWETVIGSNGGPLVAVRSAGGVRQALLAFSLEQSDLPLRPAFPVLITNLIEWLVPRADDTPRLVTPGSALPVDPGPLAEEVWAERVSLASPAATPVVPAAPATPATPAGASSANGRTPLAPPWPPAPFRPSEPGLYRVVQRTSTGESEQLVVVGGYDALESAPGAARVAPDLPAVAGEPAGPARGATPYWPWLAVGILALSTTEWWLDARGR